MFELIDSHKVNYLTFEIVLPTMKILKRILLGLIALLILIVVIGYIYLQTTKPTYSGELSLAGLQEPVEVLYDDYGVPHIYAQNEEDAYYA